MRRDEARFERQWGSRYELRTMPLGTFRREVREHPYNGRSYTAAWFVGDIALWRPLWEEVASGLAADHARELRLYEEHPDFARVLRRPTAWQLSPAAPELQVADVREYICEHCGRRYLGIELRGPWCLCVCSNRCERERRNAQQCQWRENNPPDYRLVNAARTARRAEARAARVCEHCGAPIDAARSTRRFCSDICRARAHRAGPRVTATE